ncbi:Protein unc-80, partial [Dermatophagoides pteronyssinus]
PFIRPKLSKLQDASAMEQREACKLFEKVLVQNIRFGLSPSLTKAIASVSRWRLIVSALPHVMHCCSTLLYIRRKSSFDKLSASETKLLYTLHWILLDAAEECADEELERGINRQQEHYILPITTIQTFVYLFAPLIPHLKQSDFLTSFRLENGYKIWIPLFNYCHPEIPSFLAHAKQNTFSLTRNAEKKLAIPKFGDVFIGSSTQLDKSGNNINNDGTNDKKSTTSTTKIDRKDSNDIFNFGQPPDSSPSHLVNGLSEQQQQQSSSTTTTTTTTTKTEELKKKYEYQKKDLPEPSMATYLDVAVLRCLFTSQWMEDGIDWALNFLYYRLECIEKSRQNQQQKHQQQQFYRHRSYSLPTPRRRRYRDSTIMFNIGGMMIQESKRNRPNVKDQHHHHQQQQQQDKESKLKTFRDVRRSSFSGLPGLSGFQALISSTTSSASFGRHGSEKVKHKKSSKNKSNPNQTTTTSPVESQQQQQHSSTTTTKIPYKLINATSSHHHVPTPPSSSASKSDIHVNSKHHHHHKSGSSKNHSTTTTTTNKSAKQTIRDVVLSKHLHYHQKSQKSSAAVVVNDDPQQQRSTSANSFKKRKISLSSMENRLIDRNDTKGKSMPTLHLINDDDDELIHFGGDGDEDDQYPSIYLSPEQVRTPSRTSLTEIGGGISSTNDQQQQQQQLNQQQQQSTTTTTNIFPIITITEHSPVSSIKFFNQNRSNNDNDNINDVDDDNRNKRKSSTTTTKHKFYIDDDDNDNNDGNGDYNDDDDDDDDNDDYDQHYYSSAYCSGGRNSHGGGRSATLLLRCKSDGQIDYTIETSGESLASINYVNKNGQISLVIVLKAIHSITLKDSVCTMRVCKMIHKILNKLMSFKLISKRIGSIYVAKKYKTFKPNCENPELSIHHLFMDTLFRIIKQLGCSRGCGEGRRELEAIRLKENVMKTLKLLHEMSELLFLQYCEMLVTSHPIQEIMDIFHAFFGFCAEGTTSSSSHLSTTNIQQQQQQHLTATTTTIPLKKSLPGQITGTSSGLGGVVGVGNTQLKNGYFNNFGAGFSTTGTTFVNGSTLSKIKLEVDTIIVKYTFKPFISRLVFVQKELKVQENMSLYCEVRQFISYVRENHGGIFRNAALSGLIESTKFVLQNQQQQQQQRQNTEIPGKDDPQTLSQQQPLPLSSSSTTTRAVKHKKWGANRSKSTMMADSLIINDPVIAQSESLIFPMGNAQQQQQQSTNQMELQLISATTPSIPTTTNQSKIDFFGIHNDPTTRLPSEHSSMIINNDNNQIDHYHPQNNNNIRSNDFDGGGGGQNYLTITSLDQQQQQQQSPSTTTTTVMIRRGSFNKQTQLKGFTTANQSSSSFAVTMAAGAAINQKSTFFKARKQFKNVFGGGGSGGGKNKIKQNSFDDTPDLSRKNSLQDFDRLQQQQQQDVVGIGSTINQTMNTYGGGKPGIMPTINNNMMDIPMKKTRTILFEILKDGMLKFQFLLDTCTPGSIPDAQLVAAMLDLKAPVLSRAAFLLECCHFVHRCNRGQWPGWMKMNFNFFRPSGPRHGSQTVVRSRASTTLQKYAGRCFYQWGELLSSRLEDILQNDIDMMQSAAIADSDGNQQQQQQDEDDFLTVSCTDSKEGNCPFALKIIACQLLYEITTYLRETHQYLLTQNSRRTSMVMNPTAMQTAVASVKDKLSVEPLARPLAMHQNRRWSMALSTGTFNNSAHSLMSLSNFPGGQLQHHMESQHHILPSTNDRRISFVLHEAAENENDSNSLIGSNEDIMMMQQNNDRKRLSQVGSTNLSTWGGSGVRSGSGHHESFRRRSIKLKKNDSGSGGGGGGGGSKKQPKIRSSTLVEDDYKSSLFKRSNSLRSKRKVSAASEKSDTSERFSGEESPGLFSEEGHSFESALLDNINIDTNDIDMVENIPWLKITTLFSSLINFDCNHQKQQQKCLNNCHKKIIQSASFLTKEVQRIYEKDVQPLFDFDMMTQKLLDDKEDVAKKEKKLKKILMGHTSPLKRKVSGFQMDKYLDRDSSHGHSGGVYNSQTGLAHSAIDLEYGLYESEDPRLIFHDVLSYRLESKQEENTTMLYILNQVKNPFHSIISMMLKSALILNRNQFEYLLNLSWNLILDDDIQISSSASVAIIVCSLKCPDIVINLLNQNLNHQNVDIRVSAINKFLKIWCNRHQCWQRLEEGAHLVLKLPPAAIEFTLPSPRIAVECKPVVDPPYMPIVKTKVDEVAINQEPTIQKSFVAATKTRRKQQIELISKALQDQEDKLREERENYRFNSVPVTLQAAYEPVLYHTIDDHDDQEDDVERIPLHHLQVAQCFFPSSLTTASFLIVNLLEDTQMNTDGQAVYDVAYKTIWHCLSEDSALFLRNLLEKLTREKKNVVIQTIRRLIRFVPRLPAQAAFTLYNYLIGFIMYHVRTPTEDSQSIIASVMSILWLIVPNVFGLFLKDLKQILRKEQCDATILITANVPSAKKIIVHGPDPGSIPSQFPVHEDTQFSQILTDSLDFFGIDESKHNEYFLVDTKTNQIHNLNAFVRDFYFFKRSQYPQISLVHMNPIDAYDKFQRQAFTLQFTELGKCLMSLSLIKTSYMGIQRVLFLHEELMKLPSFPRKALETNLTLYTGPMGREVLGLDTLHKISWVKLVARMFEATSGFFADSTDIHLFLNVVNGTLLLHCEDATILRLCMATYINAAHQFKNIFATNGYLLIVQTIVQIYGTHQTNSLLCRTIEFVFKQFYILHSKPFVLQMFGAVAPLLDADFLNKYESSSSSSSCQISSKAFFQLLQSLGQYTADPLDILELVDAEKPLKALDFCYQMDSETLTVLDSISLCVTVISYAPDSERGHQMLTILDSILPFHLMHMQILTTKKETPGGPRAELSMIHNISVCIKTLIYNCEALTRNFTGPQRTLDIRETSVKNLSPHIEIDEDSHSKYNAETYYPPRHNRIELDDGELCRLEFRKPRDLLLKIVSEFLTKSTSRFAELSKKIAEIHQKNSSYELLDVKCHIRLAEIAHSLLKLAPYDPQTMACKGLVRYMNEILPNSEWRQESMRPALIMVLRRLDKTFTKISKKSAIKRTTDWEAARRLLKGVYLTFAKHPYIVHLPHLKSLINVCQNIIIGDQTSYFLSESSSAVSSWTAALTQAPPPGFTSVAVRLISLQMIQLGDSQSLETICSGAFSSPEKK